MLLCTQILRQRAEEHGVAEVTWLDLTDQHGSHIGIASGRRKLMLLLLVLLLLPLIFKAFDRQCIM